MTTIAKADELATLRASLDVERAQNKALHAELAALRRTIGSAALLLEQAAAAFTLADDHEVAVEKLERIALRCRLSLAIGMGAAAEAFAAREAPTQPERPSSPIDSPRFRRLLGIVNPSAVVGPGGWPCPCGAELAEGSGILAHFETCPYVAGVAALDAARHGSSAHPEGGAIHGRKGGPRKP